MQLCLWPHRTFMCSSTCRWARSFYCSSSTLTHTLCQKPPPPPPPKHTPILLPAQPPLFIGWPSGVTMGTAVERLPCRMWGTAFEWCLGLHHMHIYQGKETLPTMRFFRNISLTFSCVCNSVATFNTGQSTLLLCCIAKYKHLLILSFSTNILLWYLKRTVYNKNSFMLVYYIIVKVYRDCGRALTQYHFVEMIKVNLSRYGYSLEYGHVVRLMFLL